MKKFGGTAVQKSNFLLRELEKTNKINLSKRLEAASVEVSKSYPVKGLDWRKALCVILQLRDGIDAGKALVFSDYHLSLLFCDEVGKAKLPAKSEPLDEISHILRVHRDLMAECIGDAVGLKFYNGAIDGREALVLRTIERYGLNPGEATALSSEALRFMLSSDIEDTRLPDIMMSLFDLSEEHKLLIDEFKLLVDPCKKTRKRK